MSACNTITLKAITFFTLFFMILYCSLGQPTTSYCTNYCANDTCGPKCINEAEGYCNMIKNSDLQQCQTSCNNCTTCTNDAISKYNSCMSSLKDTPAYSGCYSACYRACYSGCCNRGCVSGWVLHYKLWSAYTERSISEYCLLWWNYVSMQEVILSIYVWYGLL